MPGKGANMGRPAKFYPKQNCAECGELFRPRTEANVYCSKPCAYEANRNKLREKLKAATAERDKALEFLKHNSTPEGKMGCWIWSGKLTAAGYPLHTPLAPHRMAAEVSCGKRLGSQPAHHKCGISACVNPEHLVPVTHAENTAEMLARQYFIARVKELESALREYAPDHELLEEIGVPEYDNLTNRKK